MLGHSTFDFLWLLFATTIIIDLRVIDLYTYTKILRKMQFLVYADFVYYLWDKYDLIQTRQKPSTNILESEKTK